MVGGRTGGQTDRQTDGQTDRQRQTQTQTQAETDPLASPSETDFPTPAKAATRSELDKRPSLSASMIPKASLNSWICLWEKRANTLEPLFLAFFDPEPFAIV